MNPNTIGVISTPDGRSQRDLQLLSDFKCGRLPRNTPNITGDGFGVLGTDLEERSVRDRQMLASFSCSRGTRENFSNSKTMIYPRSEKDTAMLKAFDAPCKENFIHGSQQWKLARQKRENYCGGGSQNTPGLANLNFNPYNTSGNIQYVPIQ